MSRHGRLSRGRADAPAIRWAGAILVNGRGEFLLNLRAPSKQIYPGLWDLIGGTLEEGESPEDCMQRELLEETGLALDAIEPIEDFQVPLDGGGHGCLHLFHARLDLPASALLVGEGVEHRFFAPDQLAHISLVPGLSEVLSSYAVDRARSLAHPREGATAGAPANHVAAGDQPASPTRP